MNSIALSSANFLEIYMKISYFKNRKMYMKLVVILTLIVYTASGQVKSHQSRGEVTKNSNSIGMKPPIVKNDSEEKSQDVPKSQDNKTTPPFIVKEKVKIPPPIKKERRIKIIPLETLQEWAKDISETLLENEKLVVRRDLLMKSFSDVKMETRNGTAIVETMASALENLLGRRVQAAENIMRRAEELATRKTRIPPTYSFTQSNGLEVLKKIDTIDPMCPLVMPVDCVTLSNEPVQNGTHFGESYNVSLDISSVHVAAEVYACDSRILPDIHWSEELLPTFKQNYAQDAMMDFQYFCSAKGFLRHYPAASWWSMFKLPIFSDEDDVYDCRLRPWYVAASGAPRDVLILLDASGSMYNSSNKVNAEVFTLALLSALTDDDHVNVLRFNENLTSPISCFEDTLVPANHVNSAAMIALLAEYNVTAESLIKKILEEAVALLHKQQELKNRPQPCQQAIVLITDSIYENFTEDMMRFDPQRRIRLFVIWLHDPKGLRDNTRLFGEWLSCTSDGYFAELTTSADVTEQVMRLLRVLERPLVGQRKERLQVFSDIYAHVEDPRRGEVYWQHKENEEQAFRYKELRKNKNKLLDPSRLYKDFMHQESLDKLGQYYEGVDLDYKLQISVSVPVFDYTTSENITITLNEEKQRNSTRTYPVNRLLGVAGVDIPIDHLKLYLPYHQLGAGGSLFLIDHRGNIVLHDNLKPTFDGDILKPGYRTVDILDLEQPGANLPPRSYSLEWLEFRDALLLEQATGNRTIFTKSVFDNGMRALLEKREYFWKRVVDHYTAVVALPKYNRRHAVPDSAFSQSLASRAKEAVERTELSVHPEWLYCRFMDPSYFADPEFEVRHFIKRRAVDANFPMQKLKQVFSPIKNIPWPEKTYLCNEELMARFCKEAIATHQWADEHADPDSDRNCGACELGSITAFFAGESGLTRWQQYHATTSYAHPPSGSEWPGGPTEAWYKRAVATPDLLVIHAPVSPIRKMRKSEDKPPRLSIRYKWLTAARALGHPDKGFYGVAGYHFYPQHLEDVLKSKTKANLGPCVEEHEDLCDPRCDGEEWTCVLVDEGGWVVGGYWRDDEETGPEDPAREHLARLHPQAMQALLGAGVFKLHWIHDYQAVCFPLVDEPASSSTMLPSLLVSIWRSVTLMFHVARELMAVIAIVNTGGMASGDTEAEKEKRRRRLWKDYQREKYERLYDDRVLVNRTSFAACDRSRALYELQRVKAIDVLNKRQPTRTNLCGWPLVGAVVPNTNLLLLAVLNSCPPSGRPIPDPLVNSPVLMDDDAWAKDAPSSKLACWRNKEPLPTRAPHTPCYPHNYTQEEGYRQCGPWLPDPEIEGD